MKTKLLSFCYLFLTFTCSFLSAENFLETFPLASNECAASVATLASGQILTAAVDFQNSGGDILLFSLNPDGTFNNGQRLSGAGDDQAQALIATSDGGAVLVGNTSSFGQGDWDGFIIKFRRSGSIAWKKTLGTPAVQQFVRVVETHDKGLIVLGDTDGGSTSNDVLVIKYNSRGRIIWKKTISTPLFDHASGLSLTSDNGAIVAIASNVTDGIRSVLVKLKANGAVEWSRMYGSSGTHIAVSAVEAADGGYYFTELFHSSEQTPVGTVLSKLDSDGTPLWSRLFRKSANDVFIEVISSKPDGGALLGGTISSVSSGKGILFSISSDGKIQWKKSVKTDLRPLSVRSFSANEESVLAAGCVGTRFANNMDVVLLNLQNDGKFQGGCAKLRKFSVSSSSFTLTDAPATIQLLSPQYVSGTPEFTSTAVDAPPARACPGE